MSFSHDAELNDLIYANLGEIVGFDTNEIQNKILFSRNSLQNSFNSTTNGISTFTPYSTALAFLPQRQKMVI